MSEALQGFCLPIKLHLMSALAGQTTEQTTDRLLAVLRETLDLTGRAARRRLDPSFWIPRATSTFGADLTNTEVDVHGAPWGSQEPTMAFEMARLSMIVIDDYLTSIRKLLEPPFPPLPMYGQEVLARSVLESAGFAFWLVDPQITVRQRVARTYLVLWDAAGRAVENAKKVGTTQDAASAQAHLDSILRRVDDLGLGHVKKPRRLIAEERLPSKTDQVTALLAGKVRGGHEIVYSLYSAVAHGEMTGILSRRLDPPASGATSVMTITPRQLVGNVELAVVAFGQLQERLCSGGMGSGPRELASWSWEHNVGRRLNAIKSWLV